MKKLAKGISNYKELIEDNYYYVDKTMYIEKLESLADKKIMLLRPRKFGKSLFTSTLNYYYDILHSDKFEKLFGETYIGKNPTPLKNSYYILNFDFSGIDTTTVETTIKGFKQKVDLGITRFVNDYGLDFYINPDQPAEGTLGSVIEAFRIQKPDQKMYVIIDEYDHFANELLGFMPNEFKNLVAKNGKVRKWYEVLKEATKTVIDRIFITGVTPIALDSMTSGFNIAKDLTRDFEFNDMFGFTEKELIEIMDEQQMDKKLQEELLPVMRDNYDGYKFSLEAKNRIYNSNMCLNFLDDYLRAGQMPTSLVDMNIASDYKKLGNMLDLCKGEKREEIIVTTMSGENIVSEITEGFNAEREFNDTDLVSMLYYLGYLTITGSMINYSKLGIPNKVMKELYSEYFLKVLKRENNIDVSENYAQIATEMALEGKIEKAVNLTETYLSNLSNRDYQKFDEKYVKLIFYCIVMNLKIFSIKSEAEIKRKYPDLLLIPMNYGEEYYSVMIEFKYLKKTEQDKLQEKQQEAKAQIQEYANFEEVKKLNKLKCYTIVAVNDKLYVEEV